MGTNQLHMQQQKPAPVQEPLWRRRQIGYVASVSLVGLALLGSMLEQQLGLHAYFASAPLLLAVLLISLVWGTGPALLAILVSTLVLDYEYISPTGSFGIYTTWDWLLQLLPFIFSGAIIAKITAQREAARQRVLLAEQELDKYADELELDNRLKSEALSLTTSELNTSLRSISAQVQVLEHPASQQRDKAYQSEVGQHALDQIDKQTHHLQTLRDDLLSLEHGLPNETSVPLAPYDLRAVCRTLIDDPSLHHGRAIALEVPSLPVMVQIDLEDLIQVIGTVLRHALKHSSPDGAVQVGVCQHEEHILIQVHAQDQGQHPPCSAREAGPRNTPPVSSDDTGLWWLISKTIVEWYNGHIWYTPSSHDRGSTCTIKLPSYS